MKSTLLGWVVGCLILAATHALADGCVIPATAFAKVQIPDQRALIHYTNGTETLVIDTAFKGEGTNFAWVVPVPSTPKVEAATSGLFPTLQTLFRSRVEHDLTRIWLIALVAGVALGSIIWRQRATGSGMDVLLVWLLLALLSGLMLPALGTAGSTAASTRDDLNIIDRKRVGIYDTVILSSKDGSAVLDWLTKNGFATPTNFLPAIRAYAAEGWVFVASKIHLDAALSEGAKPHPLILQFQTQKPVYPLRLTGIGNETCKIELYVFGQERAQIPNFEVERCAQVEYPSETASLHNPAVPVRHPFLRKLVGKSTVATKLSAQLTTDQMKEDAYLAWEPYAFKQPVFYSEQGALITATNCTVPVVVLAALVILCIAGSQGTWARKVRKFSLAISGLAVLSWLPIYLSLPKVEVRVTQMPRMFSRNLHHTVSTALEIKWMEKTNTGNGTTALDVGWIRQQLAAPAFWNEIDERRGGTNLFTGQPCREEDSPGNYTIRQNGRKIEYVAYDIDGGEFAQELGKQ